MSLNILDLPIDVLALILSPLLTQQQPISLCPCGGSAYTNINTSATHTHSHTHTHTGTPTPTPTHTRSHKPNPLPIFLAHPAIHAIAAPLFYAGNTFVLDLGRDHGPHVRRCLDDQAAEDAAARRNRQMTHQDQYLHGADGDADGDGDGDGMPLRRKEVLLLPAALRRIRVLRLKVLKLRGWIDARIVPLVRDMIVAGNLGHLVVEMYVSVGGDNNDNNNSSNHYNNHSSNISGNISSTTSLAIFTRPPLAGLLSLLADPYLRTARLWVSPAAHPAWRPFWDDTGAHHDGEGEHLVRVDWASIVRRVDPERREVASCGTGWR